MKYRTKLFYTFILLAFISSTLSLLINLPEVNRLIVGQIKSKLLTLSVTAAASINGNALKQIQSETGVESSEYHLIKKQLHEYRYLNRRPDIYVRYIYILRLNKSGSGFHYIMDGELGPDHTPYGTKFFTDNQITPSFNKAYVTNIAKDEWGDWMTGYAPIFDTDGKRVGILGIDLGARQIESQQGRIMFFSLLSLLITFFIGIAFAYFLSKFVTKALGTLYQAVEKIGAGDLQCRVHLKGNDEFHALGKAINKMTKGLEERERIKKGFAQYVSQYVLDEILSSPKATKLEGERRKVTLLFSDIRRFTTLSEKLPPEKVVGLLNEYFSAMIEVIFNFHGTLDKFIGDGMMVEFGAPLPDTIQEQHAILAAIEMQKALRILSVKWEKEGLPAFHMGIGIHTGLAVMGNIGSEQRLEYTAIGDTVNVASRLEQATKKYQKEIIISETTHQNIQNLFVFEDLGQIELQGREKPMQAFAIDPHNQKHVKTPD